MREITVKAEQLRVMEDIRLTQDAVNDSELLDSILEHGIKDALTCRYTDDPDIYEIVDGRRRFRLGQRGGITEFRITVEALSDMEAYSVAFIKNHHRKSMSDVEEALWMEKMKNKFNITQRELAKIVGVSESWVSLKLKFAKQYMEASEDEKEVIENEYQLRVLNELPEEKKKQILESAIETGVLPSGKQIARQQKATHTPRQVLEQNKYESDEFLVYLLREQAGLTITQARDVLNNFRNKTLPWQNTPLTQAEFSPPETDKMVKLYRDLSEWYPTELIDALDSVAPAKTLETYKKNCRRAVRILLTRSPMNYKQVFLEEFTV